MKKINNLGFTHSLLLPVVITILAIGGVSYYVYTQNNNNPVTSEEEQATETLQEPLPDTLLSVSKVKELVNTQKPGSSIVSIELEMENGVLVYKITLADGTHLVFDAQTGVKTVSSAENEDKSNNESLPADFTSSIGFAKARDLALAEKPGATVQKIEFELEDGAVVFNVRFTDKSRVIINAMSGKIITIKHPEAKSEDKSDSSNGRDDSGRDDSSSDDHGNSGSDDSSEKSGSNKDDSGSNKDHSGSDSGGNSGSDDSGSHDSNDD